MSSFDLTGRRVWVAGHRGMAGAAIVRRLQREQCQIVTASRGELDLLRQADVHTWVTDQSQDMYSVDETDPGIDDVHSGSDETGTNGQAYNTW